MDDITASHRADIIRRLFAEPAWAMHTTHLKEKIDLTKDQALLIGEGERHPDFKSWSIDRLSGYALGLAYARTHLKLWLDRYEALERESQLETRLEDALGHPYGSDPLVDEQLGPKA